MHTHTPPNIETQPPPNKNTKQGKTMVCTAERRGTGGRRRRRGERRDVMEQYRKLRLVLPNINSRGKISKQVTIIKAKIDRIQTKYVCYLTFNIEGGGGRSYPIY